MNQIPNYHIFQVSTLPSLRVRIKSLLFNESIIVPFLNEAGSICPSRDTAIKVLQDRGFNIVGKGESEQSYYLFSDVFKPIPKLEYKIESNHGYGWDVVFSCLDRKEAKEYLSVYRKNEPRALHRIVSVRL